MKKVLSIMMVLAICFTVVGCTQSTPAATAPTTEVTTQGTAPQTADTETEAEKTIVKIGVLAPLSGSVSSQGTLMKMGLDACLEYFNQEVGFKNLNNVEVQLVYADSESTPDVGQTEFERLVNVENVIAVLGSYQSAVTGPCATLANKYHVPYVVINAISDGILSEDSNYVFRPCSGTYSQEASQKNWLETLNKISPIKTLAFVGSADDYGDGNLISFTRIAEQLGMEITVVDQVQSGVADMSGTVQKVKNANVDLVLASLQLNEALLFQKQMKEYKCAIPVLANGGGYSDSNFIASCGDSGEYVTSSAGWNNDLLNTFSEEQQKWVGRMQEIGEGRAIIETCCNSWLALGLTLDAMDKAAATDRETLAAAIDQTDLGLDDWPNMFTRFRYVRFEDAQLPDGTMMYNQNFGIDLLFVQILDGTWRLISPFSVIGDYGSATNPMVWLPPSWDER